MKVADPFYKSAPWLRVRAAVLARDGYRCSTPRCGNRASHVDHIVARSKGGADLDPNGLVSLCRSCHSAKTARMDGGFGNSTRRQAIGVDGWPRK